MTALTGSAATLAGDCVPTTGATAAHMGTGAKTTSLALLLTKDFSIDISAMRATGIPFDAALAERLAHGIRMKSL
jgi:hypothetical protein